MCRVILFKELFSLLIATLVYSSIARTSHKDDHIKIAGGYIPNGGRVEVVNQNVWAPVCGAEWSWREAAVVCRQLGYNSGAMATTMPFFGSFASDSWIGGIRCNGTEELLQHCRNEGDWATLETCEEYAGVYCNEDIHPGYSVTIDIREEQHIAILEGTEVAIDCLAFGVIHFRNLLDLNSFSWFKEGIKLDNATCNKPQCQLIYKWKVVIADFQTDNGMDTVYTCQACSTANISDCNNITISIHIFNPIIFDSVPEGTTGGSVALKTVHLGTDLCLELGESILFLTLIYKPGTRSHGADCNLYNPGGLSLQQLQGVFSSNLIMSEGANSVELIEVVQNPQDLGFPSILGTWYSVCNNSDGSSHAASHIGPCKTKSMTVVRPHTSVLDIGSSLTLKCLYSEGHYNGKYLWFHEGKHLANHTDQYLNISNASLDDDGQYQCFTADLNIHTNGPSSHVYVKPIIIEEPSSVNITAGSLLMISCTVKSKSLVQFEWYKYEEPLGKGSYYKSSVYNSNLMLYTSRLLITDVNLNDTGKYACTASIMAINETKPIAKIPIPGGQIGIIKDTVVKVGVVDENKHYLPALIAVTILLILVLIAFLVILAFFFGRTLINRMHLHLNKKEQDNELKEMQSQFSSDVPESQAEA